MHTHTRISKTTYTDDSRFNYVCVRGRACVCVLANGTTGDLQRDGSAFFVSLGISTLNCPRDVNLSLSLSLRHRFDSRRLTEGLPAWSNLRKSKWAGRQGQAVAAAVDEGSFIWLAGCTSTQTSGYKGLLAACNEPSDGRTGGLETFDGSLARAIHPTQR